MTETIDVTKAPLDSLSSARVILPISGDWVDIVAPPRYRELATPVRPEQTYETSATVTNAYVCNLGDETATVSIRTIEGASEFFVVNAAAVEPAPDTNTPLNMLSSIIKSGEILQARIVSGPSCAVHVSFMQRTEELIEVIL